MAFSTPVVIGSDAEVSGTLVITVPVGGVPTNAMIGVAIDLNGSNARTITSIVDSKSNSYGQDVTEAPNVLRQVFLWSAQQATALVSGDTITVTVSGVYSNAVAEAFYVAGSTTGAVLDQSAVNTAASSASPSVGPTATLGTAADIAIGVLGLQSTTAKTITNAGTHTTLGSLITGGTSSNEAYLQLSYLILTATTAQSQTWSISAAAGDSLILACYKVGPSGTTFTRTVPQTVSLVATLTRTVPQSATLLQSGLTRTVPQSASLLLSPAGTRTVPQTATLSLTLSRTVPQTATLLATTSRTVPQSASLFAAGLVRTVPQTASLSLTLSRTVPQTATLITTFTRTVPQTATFLATTSRSVPQTASLSTAGLLRTVPQTASLSLTLSRTVPQTATLVATLKRTVPQSASLLVSALVRTVSQTAALSLTQTRTVPQTATLAVILTHTRTVPQTASFKRSGLVRTVPQTATLGITLVNYNQLVINPTNTQLRNDVTADGGTTQISVTDSFTGDGLTFLWPLSHIPDTSTQQPSLSVGGAAVSMAASGSGWLLQSLSASVTALQATTAGVPASGVAISISYQVLIPVTVRLQSQAAITAAAALPNGGLFALQPLQAAGLSLAGAVGSAASQLVLYSTALTKTTLTVPEQDTSIGTDVGQQQQVVSNRLGQTLTGVISEITWSAPDSQNVRKQIVVES